jgi:hypothetical protein
VDGKVHAIKGTDGSSLPNFPFQTGHRVQAQATIAPLSPHQPNVQHILVMSFDGFLYAINGKSGCAHAVDIGEHSYAAVLVDDLCGDGNLELLVSTMNGNVYMLQTRAPYHPLKTWSSQVRAASCSATGGQAAEAVCGSSSFCRGFSTPHACAASSIGRSVC